MRPILFACALLTSCTYAAAQTSGNSNWNIDRRVDRISGEQRLSIDKSSSSARINASMSEVAIIGISCRLVMIYFERPIGAPDSSVVAIRADEKKPMLSVMKSDGMLKSISASKNDAKKVINYIRGARSLFVRVSDARFGLAEAEFDVSDLSQIMSSQGMVCK